MVQRNTPYVYGEVDDDRDDAPGEPDDPGWGSDSDLLIVDGRVMSHRSYERSKHRDDGTG